MKGIAILGSTGSIGDSTLDVIASFPDQYRVVGLAAGRNIEKLAGQIRQFRPRIVSVAERESISRLKQLLDADALEGVEFVASPEGPDAVVGHPDVEIVVTAMVGAIGLRPTLAAISRGIAVAIANKEPLVMAGKLCCETAARSGATLLPVDSEHSAIYQCLNGEDPVHVHKVILTCSGGPFRAGPADLSQVTREQALKHPTWSMGPKITIDSSTLMNKGLEVIEAHWLFSMPGEKIEILIHPQSVIHSMVEYDDGAVVAQLGTPDMRVPIGYALAYPGRLPLNVPKINWVELSQLTFEAPDYQRFRGPKLAYQALAAGGTAPAVLNAANEAGVAAFLADQIRYCDIVPLIADTLDAHEVEAADELDALIAADQWARAHAAKRVDEGLTS